MTTDNIKINNHVEVLCGSGCRSVQVYIKQLREGQKFPEVSSLDEQELVLLRQELEVIMTIYDNRCRL